MEKIQKAPGQYTFMDSFFSSLINEISCQLFWFRQHGDKMLKELFEVAKQSGFSIQIRSRKRQWHFIRRKSFLGTTLNISSDSGQECKNTITHLICQISLDKSWYHVLIMFSAKHIHETKKKKSEWGKEKKTRNQNKRMHTRLSCFWFLLNYCIAQQ